MYTENTLGLRTKTSVNIFFKNIKGWDAIKMFDKDIPGGNCIRGKTVLDLHIIARKVFRMFTLDKAWQLGGSLSFR